eukprot:364435-Chlamydomonas_euryale.AAC.16
MGPACHCWVGLEVRAAAATWLGGAGISMDSPAMAWPTVWEMPRVHSFRTPRPPPLVITCAQKLIGTFRGSWGHLSGRSGGNFPNVSGAFFPPPPPARPHTIVITYARKLIGT